VRQRDRWDFRKVDHVMSKVKTVTLVGVLLMSALSGLHFGPQTAERHLAQGSELPTICVTVQVDPINKDPLVCVGTDYSAQSPTEVIL
jgi:hypothetical protein